MLPLGQEIGIFACSCAGGQFLFLFGLKYLVLCESEEISLAKNVCVSHTQMYFGFHRNFDMKSSRTATLQSSGKFAELYFIDLAFLVSLPKK